MTMKPFVPHGYMPLCEAVEQAGQNLSKRRNIEWIPDLRTRFLPNLESAAWWANKCFRSSPSVSVASVEDMEAFLIPYRVSEIEVKIAHSANEKIAIARLEAAGLLSVHSLDDWRMWLSGPSIENRHLFDDPIDPGGTFDERVGYLREQKAVKRRGKKRDEMVALAHAAMLAKTLSPHIVGSIRKKVESESESYQSIKLRDEVEDGCRQTLYGKRTHAYLLTMGGEIFPVLHSYWAGVDGTGAVTSTEDIERNVPIETPDGAATFSGRIMVEQSRFIKSVLQALEPSVVEHDAASKPRSEVYRDTTNYLVGIMKVPKKKGEKKPDFKTYCERKFGIGSLAFKRAWDEAVGHPDTYDWSKPGESPASNSEPPITKTETK